MGNFKGTIIEESLENKNVLKKVKIIKTRIEKVTEKHKIHWIKQWTLHSVEISENQADLIAKELSQSLDSEHDWYADFKNEETHYIIFRNKVFKINRKNKNKYDEATRYGISLVFQNIKSIFRPTLKNERDDPKLIEII